MFLTPKLVSGMLIEKLHRGADVAELSSALYKFLESYNSLHILPAIHSSLSRALDGIYQSNICELVVARETDIDEDVVEIIKSKHLESPKPEYHVRIDDSVLGGYILRYRGLVYDNSVKYKLLALRHKLLA